MRGQGGASIRAVQRAIQRARFPLTVCSASKHVAGHGLRAYALGP